MTRSLSFDSVTRESTLETAGSGSAVEREIDRVTKVRVKQAIGMFKRENIAVFKEGDVYRAYVQFKIATEDAKRLTMPAGKNKNREDKFKELDDEPKVSAVQPNTMQLMQVDNEEYKRKRDESGLMHLWTLRRDSQNCPVQNDCRSVRLS